MTEYDIFAPYYDAVMGNRGDVIRLVRRHIKRHLPSAHSVLELGCGTGSILQGLSQYYEVAGIERSAEMLRQARDKLPEAMLTRGTIAGYKINRTFDAVICVFDTINHLTGFDQWQRLFESTHSHLNSGGILLFDMNTTGRLSAVAASPGYVETFNGDRTFQLRAHLISTNRIEWQVSVEIPTTYKTIQVYEEYIQEASFPLAQVSSELTKQGFTVLDCFASDTLVPSDVSDRVYFVCKTSKS